MEENNENKIIEHVSNEIIETTIDLATDYAELSLDELVGDAFSEVPIIKTLLAVGKIGLNIKERHFVKKLLIFLKEFHSGNVDENKLREFREKFDTNTKYRNKVTEHIVVFNDSFLQIEKSKIFAKLLRAHINGEYDWKYFTHLSASLESAHPGMFDFLRKLSATDFEVPEIRDENVVRDKDKEALLTAAGLSYATSAWSSGFKVSEMGKDLYKYGLG